MDTIELLLERKSVRAYEEREIPKDIKEKILEATMRAPTAGNMMLYSILDITDQDIKDKLVKTCDNQPMIGKAPMVLIFLADFRRWMDYFEVSNVEEINKLKGIEEYKPGLGDFVLCSADAFIAAQNAVVAAEAFGIGSCYIGDIKENYEIHRDLLNLPKYVFPVTMVCFGYPTESQKRRIKTTRFPKESIVFENAYKRLDEKEFGDMYKEMEEKVFKGKYLEGCKNIGQHYYKRKITSEFMAEMNRSVEVALKYWKE